MSLIVACDRNRVIGRKGKLPWKLPRDLQRFKKISMGKAIIMGRKTHLSIGCVLPGRKNIVITSNPAQIGPGCSVYLTLNEALESLREEDEVLAIGGETIYRECVPMAKRIYLTEVETNIWDGDVYFPEIDLKEWEIKTVARYSPDPQHEYGFSFKVLERY
mgnify:FL=1